MLEQQKKKFRVVISTNDPVLSAIWAERLARSFTEEFGGASVFSGTGFWSGMTGTETCRAIETVTDLKVTDKFVEQLVRDVSSTIGSPNIDGQYVHFEWEKIYSRQFKI